MMVVVKAFYWRSFSNFRSFYGKIIEGHRKILGSLCPLFVISSLVSFIVAITCAYVYLLSNFRPFNQSNVNVIHEANISASECNVFEGNWVWDDSYPLYDTSQCRFAERGFSCLANGREDRGYTKWRWKPNDCDIPRFNVSAILEQLRGKRVVFVGDSLSRTQWESLICMLMSGVKDRKSVYEINGRKIKKNTRFLGVRFSEYNIKIDFYRSVFLMQTGGKPKKAPKKVRMTLRVDKLDGISNEWVDSDILVFNSGHWWNRIRLFHEMGCYFQVGNSLQLRMPITTGFRRAIKTWASWVESNINTNRTRVFFRTFESTHWTGARRNHCQVTQRPSTKANGWERRSTLSEIIIRVTKRMQIPVTVMHLTPMGAFRKDGHIGRWSDNPSVPDCTHWCLPGVPDMWNEILFSYLLPRKQFLPQ